MGDVKIDVGGCGRGPEKNMNEINKLIYFQFGKTNKLSSRQGISV